MIRIVIIGMLATVAMGQSKFAVKFVETCKMSFDSKECSFWGFFSSNPSLESYKNIQLLNLNITITKQIKIQIYRKSDGQFLEHSSLLIKFYRKSNKMN